MKSSCSKWEHENGQVCSIAFGSFWFRLLSGTATERQSRWNPGEFWGFLALSLFWNWLPAFQLVTVVIAATFDLSGLNVLPVDRHRVLPQMRQQNSNSKKSTPWKQKQHRQVVTCCAWFFRIQVACNRKDTQESHHLEWSVWDVRKESTKGCFFWWGAAAQRQACWSWGGPPLCCLKRFHTVVLQVMLAVHLCTKLKQLERQSNGVKR